MSSHDSTCVLGRLDDLVSDDWPLLAGKILRVRDPLLEPRVGPQPLRLKGDLLIAFAPRAGAEHVADRSGGQHPQFAHRSSSYGAIVYYLCPLPSTANQGRRQPSDRYSRVVLSAREATVVAELFDLGGNARVVGQPARGELGEVWPVQTDRGKWAIKRPFEAQDEQEEEPNAAFAELVYARGITTPRTIRTPQGHLLADIDGTQFRAYGWVDIADTDPSIDAAMVGQLVAGLHAIVVHRDEPVHPWFTEPVGRERWHELAVRMHERGSRWAPVLQAYVDELALLETLLEPPQDLQVCHRDLWADNVRLHDSGGLCVFDWEEAGNCDPSQELAAVLFEYTRGDPARATTLISAYVAAGGPGRISGRGTFSMAIAQLGHIGERACRIWLDTDDPNERRRIEANVEEFLQARLSIAGIDLLIAAARAAESSAPSRCGDQ